MLWNDILVIKRNVFYASEKKGFDALSRYYCSEKKNKYYN